MTTIQCTKCGLTLTPQQVGDPCPNCGSRDRNVRVEDRLVLEQKAEVTKVLARRHFDVESGLTQVIRYSGSASVEAQPSEPIKLLEVNSGTAPSGVMPLHFGPAAASGILYPSVIIEVTPEEYQRIKAQELKLPPGWQVGDDIPKSDGSSGG